MAARARGRRQDSPLDEKTVRGPLSGLDVGSDGNDAVLRMQLLGKVLTKRIPEMSYEVDAM